MCAGRLWTRELYSCKGRYCQVMDYRQDSLLIYTYSEEDHPAQLRRIAYGTVVQAIPAGILAGVDYIRNQIFVSRRTSQELINIDKVTLQEEQTELPHYFRGVFAFNDEMLLACNEAKIMMHRTADGSTHTLHRQTTRNAEYKSLLKVGDACLLCQKIEKSSGEHRVYTLFDMILQSEGSRYSAEGYDLGEGAISLNSNSFVLRLHHWSTSTDKLLLHDIRRPKAVVATLEDQRVNGQAKPHTAKGISSNAIALVGKKRRQQGSYIYLIDLRKGPILDYKPSLVEGDISITPLVQNTIAVTAVEYSRSESVAYSRRTKVFVERLS